MPTVTPHKLGRPVNPSADERKTWGWPHYFAVLGTVFLVWEVWTLVAWLSDGPYFVTQYRDTRGADWWVARIFEALILLAFVLVVIWVVRQCIRERRLTFDAMFCIAGFNVWWANDSFNFVLPIFTFSSNWTAVNSPCGNMPFVINPDCGRMPDPILFFLPLWGGVLLASVALIGWIIGPIKRRRPTLSKAKLILLIMAVAIGFDLVFEFTMIALGLWTYLSPESFSILINGGGANRYAFSELIAGGVCWGMISMVRLFKDDKGLTFVERGLTHLSGRTRAAVTQLALIGFLNLMIWTVASLPVIAYGPYTDPIKKLPSHLQNGICDTPDLRGTQYGPCPGSPGFRMPIKKTFEK